MLNPYEMQLNRRQDETRKNLKKTETTRITTTNAKHTVFVRWLYEFALSHLKS